MGVGAKAEDSESESLIGRDADGKTPMVQQSPTKRTLVTLPAISTPNAPASNEFFSVLFGILIWKWASYGGTLWIYNLFHSQEKGFGYNYPLLLSSIELAGSSLFSYVALHFRGLKLGPIQALTTRRQALNLASIVGLGLVYTLTNKLLQGALPVNVLDREDQLLIVAILLAVTTMTLEPLQIYLPLLPMMAMDLFGSVLFFASGTQHFITRVFLSSCDSLRMILVWHVMVTETEPKLTPANVVLYTAPFEAILLLLGSITLEGSGPDTWKVFNDGEFVALLVGAVILGFSTRLANKYLLRLLSPLSLTVLTETQLVLYSFLSVGLWWEQYTAIGVVGLITKLLCCVLYAKARIGTGTWTTNA